jgi:hypothetical protein
VIEARKKKRERDRRSPSARCVVARSKMSALGR